MKKHLKRNWTVYTIGAFGGLISLEKPDIGPSTAGTREEANSFGVHVFPASLRTGNDGQDFMTFYQRMLQGQSHGQPGVAGFHYS